MKRIYIDRVAHPVIELKELQKRLLPTQGKKVEKYHFECTVNTV